MNYLYENLGDERFQEVCHAMINAEFPNSQAYPVGQPDGGRDSVVYGMGSASEDFFVFQVKFVRNPDQIADVHKWFVSTIEKEIPKIKKLIPKGAKRYYLLTNVRGTAHLDVGAIDVLAGILQSSLDIPSICWWRDDLNGKLDNRIDLKWSYPQILNGQDVLNSLVFSQLSSESSRRQSVIKAYLADQYQIDNEVKFKQIELENKLFDLFVDVPLQVKSHSANFPKKYHGIFSELAYEYSSLNQEILSDSRAFVGAAYFLLHSVVQKHISRILLEGGPGQGKSTITQFICQVHRAKLLGRKEDLNLIPEIYKNNSLRLPFKIDLRELASWISNKNPYSSNISDEWYKSNYKNSLEAFLLAHIYYHSNIDGFSITDLIDTCLDTPILLVFDGFDEIADTSIREKIIDTINHGIRRLGENIKSIQVIITSRPAAFANSAKFSNEQYPHFQLSDINNSVIKEYLEKWIAGKKLKDREANDMRRIVANKLELPHLRDLAKSPMQLAILLSLINTRGESLPNKRTELYDAYIDLFFNREAEKSPVVRNKRDLLINIHRYLAWVLHSEAELLNNNGRIEVAALQMKLKDYLVNEGHSTEIAHDLFTVMEERVCALVSRIQGTFEFEVQPLREYFCAKYLYDTSPYTPAGKVRKGTLPDRFDALVRNFYWENVLRFFAGCFDRGELPMLIDKLQEANNSEYLRYTNYIRIVTSELLSDFVFSQYPKLMNQVMKIILDGVNIGAILNGSRNSNEAITLPIDCGREELVVECFKALSTFPHDDYADELLSLIIDNPENTVERWLTYAEGYTGQRLNKWLRYGREAKVLYQLEDSALKNLIQKDDEVSTSRLKILIDSNKWKIIDSELSWKKMVLEGILGGNIIIGINSFNSFTLNGFGMLVNPWLYKWILLQTHRDISELTFRNYIISRTRRRRYMDDEEYLRFFKLENPKDEVEVTVAKFYEFTEPVFDINLSSWVDSLTPWSQIIDNAVLEFGERWSFKVLSAVAAGIRSHEHTFSEINSLHDPKFPLSQRVRAIRLKSGHSNWWKDELQRSPDIDFSLLILLSWGTAKTLIEQMSLINLKIESLQPANLSRLSKSLRQLASIAFFNIVQQKQLNDFLTTADISDDLVFLLGLRFPESNRNKFTKTFFGQYAGNNQNIISAKLDYAIRDFFERNDSLENLAVIKELYQKLSDYKYGIHHSFSYKKIGLPQAKSIMTECKNYPKALVYVAERTCRQIAGQHSIPIGQIANKDEWFAE